MSRILLCVVGRRGYVHGNPRHSLLHVFNLAVIAKLVIKLLRLYRALISALGLGRLTLRGLNHKIICTRRLSECWRTEQFQFLHLLWWNTARLSNLILLLILLPSIERWPLLKNWQLHVRFIDLILWSLLKLLIAEYFLILRESLSRRSTLLHELVTDWIGNHYRLETTLIPS